MPSSPTNPSDGRDAGGLGAVLPIAIVVVALAIGSYLRLSHTGSALLFGDEFHSLLLLGGGYGFLASTYDPNGSGLALPILQRLFSSLFGLSHWTIRAPAYLAGILLIPGSYLVGRKLVGPRAAATAALLTALSGPMIFYSHFGRAYSLAALLGLLLLGCTQKILDSARPSRALLAGSVLLVALLPYVQPVSLGVVLPMFAAAMAVSPWRDDGGRKAVTLAGVACLGGVLTLLLHAPAYESLSAFVSAKTEARYVGQFGFLDVAALLAGRRAAAVFLVPALVVALGMLLWSQSARSLPLIASCIGTGVALLIVQPFGDAYAYARYALLSLPFAYLVLAWGIDELVGLLAMKPRLRAAAGGVVGAGLVAALFAVGPYGLSRTDDGPHANTYMSLYPLAAFDEPWEGMPAFYREVAKSARPIRLVEAPALLNRSRHLYRNYYLQHGQESWLGLMPPAIGALPDGPYVSFASGEWMDRADADFLVLHVAIEQEVEDYWKFVFGDLDAKARSPEVAAYMTRHERYPPLTTWMIPKLQKYFQQTLGTPYYQDERIRVWKLR